MPIEYFKCSECKCVCEISFMAQWKGMCEDCETKIFEFYGAVSPPDEGETEEE
jgi:hypothetical protein